VTLFRLTLGSHRGGFAATTAIVVLFAVLNGAGYVQLAGSDPAQRAVFARQMELLGRQLSYILPLPIELETMAGYLQWRVFGTVGLIYAFWSVIAASGAGRGDEERGLVETWLAAGTTRLRYVVVRAAAFLGAASVSIAAMIAATWLVGIANGEPISAPALALQGLALMLLTAFCFAFSLAVAQIATTRRGAGRIAGIALLALFLVDASTRTGGLERIRWLSPFWAYDQTHPLVRGGALDGPATAALAGATLVVLLVAVAAFASRDLGASLLRPAAGSAHRAVRPSRDPLLRLPVVASIDQQRGWVIGWMIGLAALGGFLVSLTRTMLDSLLAIPSMRTYFERLGSAGYDSFVAVIWGSTALLLLALFAIFEVNAWVADDAEGRLEAVLAQPVSRARVALERMGSLGLGATLIALTGALVVWITTRQVGIDLTPDRFAVGSVLMILVPLAFGAIGSAIASWRPRVAVPLLVVVAVVSYLTLTFAPLFEWPAWVARTSIFALYGEPIARPVDWPGILLLAAISMAGTLAALLLFERRDVAR
jgi:ABC-2 type transport system permease protein